MRYLKLILALIIFLCISAKEAQSQSPLNWDEDIRCLRNTAVPNFHCKADDVLQYSPAALMLALKAGGYEGRTGWWQMLTADALSIALMTGVTQGIKYSVKRVRPDDSQHNSFPSGHTGTAFLAATMLHKEYGWRSPWWSIGGYTIAAFTGVSRILNNRHWMTDIMAGAAIGIGSVHLGYYLADLIFKKKHINPAYEAPRFMYDPTLKHYVAEFYFGRRFILGAGRDYFTNGDVVRGGSAGLSANIPVVPGIGVITNIGAHSLTYSSGNSENYFDALAGGYYNIHPLKRFEVQFKAMAGMAWKPGYANINRLGAEICTGAGLSFMLNDNFKIKVFADYNTIGSAKRKWMHSIVLGWGAGWVW